MKPSRNYVENKLIYYDFVVGIKDGKISVLKDRYDTTDKGISLSELFQRIIGFLDNPKLKKALDLITEKIQKYETFE